MLCSALLAGSILLLDWQLVSELKALKADALATLKSMRVSAMSDVDGTTATYEKLSQWDELFIDVTSQIVSLTNEDNQEKPALAMIDPALLPNNLLKDCEPAFDVLRAGSTVSYFPAVPDDLDTIGLPQSPDIEHLRRTLWPFAIGVLLKFERGESASMYEDLGVLRRIGSQLRNDIRFEGQFCATHALMLVRNCVARILRNDGFSTEELRSLIDEKPNALAAVFNACRWEGARHAVTIGNTHLNIGRYLSAQNTVSNATPQALAFGQMGLRLAHARDDIIAREKRNAFYDQFSKRMDRTVVKADEIAAALSRSVPNGLLQSTDNRDFVIYTVMAGSDSQSLVNLMAAATLYKRTHGQYPSTVADLVPELIKQEPLCRHDGLPFRFIAIDDGIAICNSEDEKEIKEALDNEGTLRPDVVQWLRAPEFLGNAYDQAHGLDPGNAM